MTSLGILALLVGCGPGFVEREAGPEEWSQVGARGDWDDLDAALEVAAARVGMAVVGSSPGEERRAFELVTAGDEPVSLEISKAPGAGEGDLVLRCRVGRFGYDARQAWLLEALGHRLEQLRGVETAPVSW